jgi:DNA-binding LacI/PurR family transcriptional regulator
MNSVQPGAEPLYLQIKRQLLEEIDSGRYDPGGFLESESILCARCGVSRITVRKALQQLVSEGYLERIRGKGTTVIDRERRAAAGASRLVGLVLNRIDAEFNSAILSGFVVAITAVGYLPIVCSSEEDAQRELLSLRSLVGSGARSVTVLPCEGSRLQEAAEGIRRRGVHLGLIDRNPGIDGVDFVSSDHYSGTYAAVRHVAMQGFTKVLFVSYDSTISSVQQRYAGYVQAVRDFGLNNFKEIQLSEEASPFLLSTPHILLNELKAELAGLKEQLPFAVVAVNDLIAAECLKILEGEGLAIGLEVAVVGFDDLKEARLIGGGLTTVAQNGRLIGRTAAGHVLKTLEENKSEICRAVLPTQLIVRRSCGEYDRAHQSKR